MLDITVNRLLEHSLAALQDVVTRGGKFLFLYKRPGHRVIVNSNGVMMVSPSAIETTIQRRSGGTAMTHLYATDITAHDVLNHIITIVDNLHIGFVIIQEHQT